MEAGRVPGLSALAKCSLVHPERDSQKLLGDRMGLALPIPFTTFSVETVGKCEKKKMQRLERFSLQDWARLILTTNSWHHLSGLIRPNPEREMAIWTSFWQRYKQVDGEHEIFKLAESGQVDLSRAAAILLHGDEGRGRRRQAFMVLSYASLLGRGTVSSTALHPGKKVKKSFLKMKLNFRGHTYTTRMLCGVLPKRMYEASEATLDALLQAAYEDARLLAREGVKDASGVPHYMVLLGTTGDWPFLQKAGKLDRTFSHAVKTINQIAGGMCHLCDAGPVHAPWEQIGTRQPDWLQTVHATSPFVRLPGAVRVPHTPHRLCCHYKFDLFHCWHLGVGRNFTGSIIALLSDLESGNVDLRFEKLTVKYKAWCVHTGHSPITNRITKDTISWGTTAEYPTSGWFKGGITTNIMQFFESLDDGTLGADEPLLALALEAAKAINQFFRMLYSGDIWLNAAEAGLAGELMSRFLRRYGQLAQLAFEQQRALFVLQPKLHTLHHFAIDLLMASKAGTMALNPLVWSCQQSEDFVGRGSRLSRKVTARQTIRRVMERYRQAAYTEWVNAGLLIESQRAGM